MIGQGSAQLDAAWFANLSARISGIQSCPELQDLVADAIADINAVKSAIGAELALLQPVLALIEAPGADLGKIATWISSFIGSFLTPYTRPVAIYASQLSAMEAQIASLLAAISAKAAEFTGCVVAVSDLV